MSTKKIFVIGGAGFVGYHVVKELLRRNCEVTIYDAFLSYISPLKSLYPSYLDYRLRNIGNDVRIIRGDIRNRGILVQSLKETRPEIVIHLAAIPLATASNQFSEEAIQINLIGTTTVLECIRAVPHIERFVFTSSSFVYGDFQEDPADEEHPTAPLDIYGATKLSSEILIQAFHKKFNIDYTIVRPSAVYGPTDANRRVSQIFIEKAIRREPLIIHQGGLNKIDFTYVKDTAQGIVLATLSEKGKNQIFNITWGEGRHVVDFINILRDQLGDIVVKEEVSSERRPNRGGLDIRKAREMLNYQPLYSLEKGIEEYLRFLSEQGFLEKIKSL